jgi:cytochrome c oxidase cbb3-type subunit 3
VLGSIFGCAWLLWATRKSQKHNSETEQTMGHEFDGIEEYDNPLPKWWMHMFLGTIIFGLIYLALYPGLGTFKGLLGWTSTNQWEKEVDEAQEKFAPLYAELAARPIEELAKDEKALKMGQRLFANNCSTCHGSAARGNIGFPNLTDHDWLYGGTPEKIKETLTNGRNAMMPAWGAVIGEEGVQQVAHYVRGLSGQETINKDLAAKGQALFQANCTACHGAAGEGMEILGAPNLTDGTWLYGGTQSLVEMTLRGGRNGIMPSFKATLGDEKIHLLTAYVYSLSQTQP